MFRNFITVAWRHIIRHKIYSSINVAGLALGMVCCLFIFLWVADEKAVDNFHANNKQLYAVYQTITVNGKTEGSYATPLLNITGQNYPSFLLENIDSAVPAIKHQSYYATGYELPWGHAETFQAGDKKIKLEGSRAGKDFFRMFSYPLIEGNAATALQQVKGIAISRKMASLFFGNPHDAMGKTLRYENQQDFMVTAVFEDLPSQSSIHFDFLFNWDAQKTLLNWASNNFNAYLELQPNADPVKVAGDINRYVQPRMVKQAGVKIQIGLQRFGDQYLYDQFVNGVPSAGRIEYIRIFSWVALFILVIACINFMNLATAQAVKRAKEVGLRKVVGSGRKHLIYQFYGESFFFALLAMMVAIGLLLLFLPAFNHFTGKQIHLRSAGYVFWGSLFCLTLLTALIAGSYPALYLSSLKPVKVLKGVVSFTHGATLFRKGLTVFQFILSIVLLVAMLVISRQTNYVQTTNLGYNRDNLMYVRIEGNLTAPDKYHYFKERALQMPGISMVDRSTEAPHAMGFVVTDAVNWQGKIPNTEVGFKPSSVGYDFIKLMNLQIAEGRDFSRSIATDSADAFMVNEEAVRAMGMKNPIGKWISAWAKKGHIIAVLKDYHTHSLREPIKPVVLDVKEYEYFGVIIIRTHPGKTRQALANLASLYKEINPGYPFSYQFVDEEYRKLYNNELIISRLSVLFAALAIVISCLGLLGLVMFAAEQRVKEIGIRKVLGATVVQVIALFSADFFRLIMIAFLIATPLAWYGMHQWLQSFAYRITISWWIFMLAGGISFFIAMLTISIQSLKAARANPIKSLRTE